MAHNIPKEPRSQEDHFNRIRGTRTETFDPYVDEIVSPATEFEKIAEEVRHWSKLTIHNPEWFDLYGLYKQQAAGDYDHAREQVTAKPQEAKEERVRLAKREAWMKNKGMSIGDARKEYMRLANSLRDSFK